MGVISSATMTKTSFVLAEGKVTVAQLEVLDDDVMSNQHKLKLKGRP